MELGSVCFVLALILHVAFGQHNWTECDSTESVDPLYVHELVISPLPIHLPGKYNISFDASMKQLAPELLVDVQVGMTNETSGEVEHVYPLDRDYFRVFEGCLLINKLLFNNYSLIERHIDTQIDTLFASTLGYHAGCPLLPSRIVFTDQSITLPVDLIKFNALSKGQYVLNIVFRSRRAEDDVKDIGCVTMHLDYAGHIME